MNGWIPHKQSQSSSQSSMKRTPSPKSSPIFRKQGTTGRSQSKKSSSLTTVVRTNTAAIAERNGARVVTETAARVRIRPASQASPHLRRNPPDIVVFLDGDYSDYPTDMPRLLQTEYATATLHSSSAQGHKATQKRHYYRKHASATGSPAS